MASGSGPVFLIAIDKSEASEEVFNCKSEHHYTLPVADPGFPRRRKGGGCQPSSLGRKPSIWQDYILKTATDCL